MKGLHTFESEITLPAPRDAVFAFFSDAHNLERITPPELQFHILTPAPIVIREGTLIDYRLRLFGIGFHWQTKISRWNPPDTFTDEQLHGPYASWIHTHSFEERGTSTLVRDVVRYRLPLYAVGELGHFFVRKQIVRIFAHRTQVMESLFPVA